MLTRRTFVGGAAAVATSAAARPAAAQSPNLGPNRLVLLGTKGGPSLPLGYGQSPSANLIVYDNVPYVIDTGYGVSFKLVAAKFPMPSLRYLFITHHHSDHNAEFGLLLNNAWAMGLRTPVDAYGPAGLKRLADGFWGAYRFDIETRMADEGRPDLRKLVVAHEFDKPGLVMQNDDVRVSCALVRHPPITQAYAYRFDAKDRSIVISGDTAYAPELAEFAKGADVLVHEIMHLGGLEALLKRVPNAATLREHLLASHTLPEDVGRVAAAAGVKTLVLSHFVPGDDPSITDEMWAEGVRKHYAGRIVVGKDLMEVS
jgi:ribonuclease BN (tRNA processing enzyme)